MKKQATQHKYMAKELSSEDWKQLASSIWPASLAHLVLANSNATGRKDTVDQASTYLTQNCSQWPLAEKTGRRYLLNRVSCPPDDQIGERTELHTVERLTRDQPCFQITFHKAFPSYVHAQKPLTRDHLSLKSSFAALLGWSWTLHAAQSSHWRQDAFLLQHVYLVCFTFKTSFCLTKKAVCYIRVQFSLNVKMHLTLSISNFFFTFVVFLCRWQN